MPAGKRLLQRRTGVSKPGHLFKVAQQGIRPVVRDANALGLKPTPLSTFSESLHTTQRRCSLVLQCYRRCRLCLPADCRHSPGGIVSGAGATVLPEAVRRQFPFNAALVRSSDAALWLRTCRDQCWASSMMLCRGRACSRSSVMPTRPCEGWHYSGRRVGRQWGFVDRP